MRKLHCFRDTYTVPWYHVDPRDTLLSTLVTDSNDEDIWTYWSTNPHRILFWRVFRLVSMYDEVYDSVDGETLTSKIGDSVLKPHLRICWSPLFGVLMICPFSLVSFSVSFFLWWILLRRLLLRFGGLFLIIPLCSFFKWLLLVFIKFQKNLSRN